MSRFHPTSKLVLAALVLIVAAFVFLNTTPVMAQATVSSGSIQGTITDPQGAIVPGAKVTISNASTGQTLGFTTTSTGAFTTGALVPGQYTVKVEAKGFETTQAPVTVQVGTITPANIRMKVGSETQTVTVEATAVQVNTEQATVQNVVTAQQIDKLPANGRNFLDLAQLTPGVQIQDGNSFDPTKNGFSSVSIGGRAGRTARIEVDGVDISDENVGTTTQNVPTSAIQEFQIAQSTLDLSSELTSSGEVNVVTRSGTNNVHGEGFYLFRDGDAGFANFPGGQKPAFQRNNPGGRLGGPIWKDKMFFFLALEHNKQEVQVPLTFSDFPNLNGGYPAKFRETEFSGRMDWKITPNNYRAFYKFGYDNLSDVSQQTNFQPFLNRNNTPSHTIGLDFTSGTFTHSIRVAYNKMANHIADATAGSGIFDPLPGVELNVGTFGSGPNLLAPQTTIQANWEAKYDGSKPIANHVLRYGVAYNHISGDAFASFFGLAPNVISGLNATLSPSDLSVAAAGPGGVTNPLNFPVDEIILGNGQGFFSEKPNFNFPFGGIFDNRFEAYLGDSWKVWPNFSVTYGLRYVRDTGRDDNDLPPITCSQVVASNFTIPPCSGNALLLDQFGFIPGLGRKPRQPNANFAPQVGIAWDPWKNGKTSFRAGAGLYYENTVFNDILFDRVIRLQNGGEFNSTLTVCPPNGGTVVGLPNGPLTSIDGLNIGTQICGQPIDAVINGVPVSKAIMDMQSLLQSQQLQHLTGANPFFLGQFLDTFASVFNPDFVTPRSVQMNVGVERQLWKGTVISADYVRNVGTHYLLGVDTNHVGDARFLNVQAAVNAITATNTALGCPAGVAGINCAIASGATIASYAGNGLDSANQFLGGLPATFFGLTPATGAAFPGINPLVGQNRMLSSVGRSTYDGLQVSYRQNVANPLPEMSNLNLTIAYSLSRFDSNVPLGGGSAPGDQDFLSNAVDFRSPTRFFGPAALDRTHQISIGSIMEFKHMWLPRWGVVAHFDSPLAQTLFLPTTGGGDIFIDDATGDGSIQDVLPGTQVGSFMRGTSPGSLNQVLTNYNNHVAGTLSPAGAALVNAGLFTQAQLVALGATLEKVTLAPSGEVGLGWLNDIGTSLAWPIKAGEYVTIEPSIAFYNVGNFANFDPTTNRLSGILGGAPGSVNGTTQATRSNRVGVGSGVFALGAPRQLEFGLKLTF